MKSRIIGHLRGTFRHHTSLMLATILVLTGSFFVSGGLLLVGQNLNKILTLWGESLQMSVYLKENTTPDQVHLLQRRLTNDRRVARAEWVSREAALAGFLEQMASYAPDLLKDAQLVKFIPESFQIQLSDVVTSALQLDTLKTLADELKSNEIVEDVSYGQDWVRTYAQVVRLLSSLGSWVILLLITAAAFVISNSVSSSLQQRRSEIEVLELVGASKNFIRAPFLVEGVFVGLISTVLAMGLLGTGFWALRNQLHDQITFLQLSHHLSFFSWGALFGFALFGMLIGSLSAQLSLRKLNDGWAASRAKQGF